MQSFLKWDRTCPGLRCYQCIPLQVCDSDTVLDPACTIEMLRVLEEDPQVGGVGGDVQVRSNQGFLGVEAGLFCFKPSGICPGNESLDFLVPGRHFP